MKRLFPSRPPRHAPARDVLRANFLVTVTTFSAPRQVTLEELRLETCYPLDEDTAHLCRCLADGS